MDCKFRYYYVGRYWCGANSVKDWVDDYKESRHPNCSLREYRDVDFPKFCPNCGADMR